MPNIDEIHIRGFQSHVDSHFRLGPGLNVITGPSDAGKTSIIRSVRWVAFNEPSGEAFLNESVGETEVVIQLDTGITITKRRRKGKTSYQLSTMDEPFEKAEVPEEVKSALGITKQGFGDFETALNFAFQLEAPFLISETASAGAKVLGKLAGTEVVDLATKSVSKDTYQARQEKNQSEKDIQRLDGQLLEYADLEDLKRQLEACQFLISECDERLTTTTTLQELFRKHDAANDQIAAVAEKLDTLAVLPEIEEDLKEIEKAQQRYDRLLDLYSLLNKTTDQVAVLTERLTAFAELGNVTDVLTAATNSSERVQALTILYAGYQKYAQVVNQAEMILESTRNLNELGEYINTASVGVLKLTEASQLLRKYNKLQDDIYSHALWVEQYAIAETGIETLNNVHELFDRQQVLKSTYERFTRMNLLLHVEATKLESAENDLQVAQEQHATVWEGLEVCPLCENPISGGPHLGH